MRRVEEARRPNNERTRRGTEKSEGDERKENQHQRRRESREDDVRDGLLLISQAFI